jgi:Tol biopolymer transport system component
VKYRTCVAVMMFSSGMILPGFARAQSKHTPTLEESLSLKSIGSPRISPDGRFVAYQVQQANWKDNEFVRQIWLANVETGKSIQLTRGKKSAGGADWSSDGHWLAFITEREPAAVEPFSAVEKEEKKKRTQRTQRTQRTRRKNLSRASLPQTRFG